MKFREDKINDQVYAEAYDWLQRLNALDCSHETRIEFDVWKNIHPDHEMAFSLLEESEAMLELHRDDPELQAMADIAYEETETKKSSGQAILFVWKKPAVWIGAAACLLLAVLISQMPVMFSDDELANQIAADSIATEFYETAIGERSTVSLPDGSQVVLNTNSKMQVSFSEYVREIRLVEGQGYFDVAKDVNRPFIVKVGDKRVVALGTAFDIRYDREDRFEVTLIEGSVDVSVDADTTSSGPAKETSLPEKEKIRLQPGERLVAVRDISLDVQNVNTTEITSWRSGKVVFRDKLLSEVISEMNRYSLQRLVLDDDPRLIKMRVSGAFTIGQVSSFVSALETMHGLEARRIGENELSLHWQN